MTQAVRAEWRWKRRIIGPKIKARDGFQCCQCGLAEDIAAGVRLEIDHIIPIRGGGTNSPDNLQTLCRPCNLAKGPVKGGWL